MENWTRANLILSSRKKNILVDHQNFEFKRESENGARYYVIIGMYRNCYGSGRRSLRQEGLQISLQNYTRATWKEFMFGLRGD